MAAGQSEAGGPVRTCVGCRARSAKDELIRIVAIAAGEEVVVDVRGRMPGRGAYLHVSVSCLERAERRRAMPRALRLSAATDITPVRRDVEQRLGLDACSSK